MPASKGSVAPVWVGYFADPALLRVGGHFFAYGTDAPGQPTLRRTGRAFPILFSEDLEEWNPVGGALMPRPELSDADFWAPEVIESDGRFLMVYSAGGREGEGHRLRIAVAERPEGPFLDQGRALMPNEPFSIDGSFFRDPVTRESWLFFAKDFLEGDFPGTGIAAIRLSSDGLAVEGEILEILRPSADWQLFERDRYWYGRTWPAWYTVEGPYCVYRDGRYWLFYSGGLWKGESYGVDVVVSERPQGPYRRPGGLAPPSILRSRPGLRGPGHNSVVEGPEGRHHICFHAWDEAYTQRQMYVEPLTWKPLPAIAEE